MAEKSDDAQAIAFFVGSFLLVGLALALSPIFLVGVLGLIIYKCLQLYWGSIGYRNRIARAQTQELVAVAAQIPFPDADAFTKTVLRDFRSQLKGDPPAYAIIGKLSLAIDALYENEELNELPAPPPDLTTLEGSQYRDALNLRIKRTSDQAKTMALIHNALIQSLSRFTALLPPAARQTWREISEAANDRAPPAWIETPFADLVRNKGELIQALIGPFFSDDLAELGLFHDLRFRLVMNHHELSNVPLDQPMSPKLIMPVDYEDDDIAHAFLKDTPLEEIFEATVSFDLPHERRFEHWHLIGGSGHGKTQTLQHIIMRDLEDAAQPALIIVDSQGEMLRKIQRLKMLKQPSDRLIIIDPEDDEPPALNMFDTQSGRIGGYSRAVKEQIEAGVIELYSYIFGSLAAEMTSKQGTAFAFVARLMLSIPGATIHTLRELMEEEAKTFRDSRFRPYVEALDQTARSFFENQFYNKSAFGQTRQQIARRLYGVLQAPAFDRMFSATENRLDMFDAMQNGKVILINTSKALLKTEASALFGRYMIALTLRAAFERVAVKERRPAFLIIDEAAEYFDDNLEALLAQARKFNLGVLFAHQHLDQLSSGLRSAVAANTSIKMAGGLSDRDARTLAPDMRTTAEFLTGMRKDRDGTQFACFVRNQTETAIRLDIPFGTLETAPRMDEVSQQMLLAMNRLRYSASRAESRQTATSPDPPEPVPAAPPEKPKSPKQAASSPASIAEPAAPDDDWRS